MLYSARLLSSCSPAELLLTARLAHITALAFVIWKPQSIVKERATMAFTPSIVRNGRLQSALVENEGYEVDIPGD